MFQLLPVEWHESLPSTNTYLVERVKADPGMPSGTVIAAREQTAGRGRQQRTWKAAPGRNLTCSFLWNAALPAAHVPSMAQAMAVGIARFLASQGIRPAIKWPNDVQVGGKKVGGILCEVVNTKAPDRVTLVAGVGLNVNMTADEAAAIDQPATSLALETGRDWEIEAVLQSLLDGLVRPLNAWAPAGFAGIEQEFTQFTPPAGTPVGVRDGNRHVEGTLAGFTPQGALRLTLPDGTEQVFYSGDLH